MREKRIVHLNNFEGPLDLLLYLISKNEVDIYDIPIIEITNQYLDYIYKMNELNIEVASEFVVMASTLLEIKSKTLLPLTMEDEEEQTDPREELVKRLVEYKAFKEISDILKQKDDIYNKSISKDGEYFEDIQDEVIIKNINIDLLSKTMSKLLLKHKIRLDETDYDYSIDLETFSVDDILANLTYKLKTEKKISFLSVFEKNQKKGYIIAAFLAILELFKLNMVDLKQDKKFDDIILLRK